MKIYNFKMIEFCGVYFNAIKIKSVEPEFYEKIVEDIEGKIIVCSAINCKTSDGFVIFINNTNKYYLMEDNECDILCKICKSNIIKK